MNPIESLVQGFQDLVAQVPELVQPLIVALAAAIPFVEGEGGAVIGVMGGIHPVTAGLAAAAGNFLCVFLVVALGARARAAVTARRARRGAEVPVEVALPVEAAAPASVPVTGSTVDASAPTDAGVAPAAVDAEAADAPAESKGRQKFRRYLVRFGVPGASLLGPLALPTQFTAALLVGSGVSKAWVLLWQAIAIALWTTFATVSASLALLIVYNVG